MLPGYGIALIVLSVLAVLGLVIFWLTKGHVMWKNRTSYPKYNKFMNCLRACDCRDGQPACIESCQTARRRRQRTRGSIQDTVSLVFHCGCILWVVCGCVM